MPFFSWWSGTKTVDSEEDVPKRTYDTKEEIQNRRPNTRSQNGPESKKRKTINGTNDAGFFTGDNTASLEEIAASLQTYLAHAEQREKQFEEQLQKTEARAQRIESLLKKVLANQSKALEGEINEEKLESEETDEEEMEFNSPFPEKAKVKGAWTSREHQLVAMGLALHGRDFLAVTKIVEGRSRSQVRGFIRRNERRLGKDIKKFPARSKKEKQALLEKIQRLQGNEGETEEEDDSIEDIED